LAVGHDRGLGAECKSIGRQIAMIGRSMKAVVSYEGIADTIV